MDQPATFVDLGQFVRIHVVVGSLIRADTDAGLLKLIRARRIGEGTAGQQCAGQREGEKCAHGSRSPHGKLRG